MPAVFLTALTHLSQVLGILNRQKKFLIFFYNFELGILSAQIFEVSVVISPILMRISFVESLKL